VRFAAAAVVMTDSLKVRGQLVHAEALEHELCERLGLLPLRCVVVADWTAPALRVVAIVERPPGDWEADAVRALRATLGPSVEIVIRPSPRGTILRTTSGKPRRRSTWEAFVRAPERLPAAP
jgi:hypothetical protein